MSGGGAGFIVVVVDEVERCWRRGSKNVGGSCSESIRPLAEARDKDRGIMVAIVSVVTDRCIESSQ